MIGRRLTTLLLCVTLCWTQDTEWDWPCGNVTAQDGVNISQVFGRWYLAAENAPNLDRVDTCFGIEFSRIYHGDAVLAMSVYVGNSGAFTRLKNHTLDIIGPAKWHYDSFPVVVVDFPSDGSTLSLTTCTNPSETRDESKVQMTMVLSKSRTPTLGPVYSHLRAAGVEELGGEFAYNLTLCPSGFVI